MPASSSTEVSSSRNPSVASWRAGRSAAYVRIACRAASGVVVGTPPSLPYSASQGLAEPVEQRGVALGVVEEVVAAGLLVECPLGAPDDPSLLDQDGSHARDRGLQGADRVGGPVGDVAGHGEDIGVGVALGVR